MAATIQDAVSAARCTFVSIHCPERPGDPWRASVRNGPGWIVGDYAPSLDEAVRDACHKLSRVWDEKRAAFTEPPQDDLTELLG